MIVFPFQPLLFSYSTTFNPTTTTTTKKSFQQGQNSNLRLGRLAISAKSRKLSLQQRLCGPAQEPAVAEMSLPCRTP